MDIYRALKILPIKRFQEPPPRVAVIRLSGVIGGGSPLRPGLNMKSLEPVISQAFKLPRLKAVALVINSPGGSPVQSHLIAKRIRDLAGEKEVPVLAFCEDVAASGGYWLACAGDEIYVQEASILGSIGVIAAGFGFAELMARYGVERRIYTAGAKKSILDPFKPEDPEDVEKLSAIQLEIHESFKNWVRTRRGERLKNEPDRLFSGEFWAGGRALELGLADAKGDLREVLRGKFGDKVDIKPIGDQSGWLRRRFALTGPNVINGLLSDPTSDWASTLLAAAEERALWSRYGL